MMFVGAVVAHVDGVLWAILGFGTGACSGLWPLYFIFGGIRNQDRLRAVQRPNKPGL